MADKPYEPLVLTADEEAKFMQETGMKRLETLGLITIVDGILKARHKEAIAELEHRRWLDNGAM
jgi:hypothetical protein